MGALSMDRTARETFLADRRIAVLSVERPARPPHLSPVWYRYTPGGVVELTTEPGAEKTTLLTAASRAALCVQREDAPYAYVTVEGPVTIGPASDKVRIDIASRYLGPKAGPRYVERGSGEDVLVTLTPERWHTVDFAKLGSAG